MDFQKISGYGKANIKLIVEIDKINKFLFFK